jgi:hypothetical protein
MINGRSTAARWPMAHRSPSGGRGPKTLERLDAGTAIGRTRRNFFRDAEIFDRKSKNDRKTPSFEID